MPIVTHFNRVHRKKKPGVSMHEVHAKSGVPLTVLRGWRYGRITRFDAVTLDKLCSYFRCPPGDLLEWVPPEKLEKLKAQAAPAPDAPDQE